MKLRPYQSEAIDAARERLRRERSTLVVLPTGAGKTVVFSEIARLVNEKGGRVLVLAHRTELLDQATAKITAVAPDLTVEREQAASLAHHGDVVVASVQTLHREKRLARWAPDAFPLIIVDEAHHAAARSYQKIFEHFAGAKRLGFTATPDRTDGAGLRSTFESVAFSMSMLDLVRLGYLAPITGKVVTVDGFDASGVKIVAGDFQERELAEALNEPGVLDSVAKAIVEHSEDRSTLVFVPGVAIAHDLAALLNWEAGGAVAIDGTTPPDERAIRFAQFQSGSKRFLVNVGIATEGTDLPRCSCVAIVRPTMSRSLFVQMVGRGTRLFEGKTDCLVLNFAPSNCKHRIVVPVDAMLGDDLDELTKQAIRELAELEPDDDIETLFEKAAPIVEERKRRVHSIAAKLRPWDPMIGELLDLAEPKFGREIPDDERKRAADQCLDAGIPPKTIASMTDVQIVATARSIRRRKRDGLCSLKIARQLHRRGLNPNVAMADGIEAIRRIAAAGWKRTPPDLSADPRFRLPKAGEAA